MFQLHEHPHPRVTLFPRSASALPVLAPSRPCSRSIRPVKPRAAPGPSRSTAKRIPALLCAAGLTKIEQQRRSVVAGYRNPHDLAVADEASESSIEADERVTVRPSAALCIPMYMSIAPPEGPRCAQLHLDGACTLRLFDASLTLPRFPSVLA